MLDLILSISTFTITMLKLQRKHPNMRIKNIDILVFINVFILRKQAVTLLIV